MHVLPSFGIGGVPIRIARIVNHFGARYRHTIIALDQVLSARERLRPDLAIDLVPFAVDKRRPLAEILRYRRDLRARKPDLLITYNWGAIDWAMANRVLPLCPHLHQEDGFGVEEAERQFRRRVLYRRLALGGTRKLVVPSRKLLEIAQSVWRFAAEKVVYLPNGIDVERFAGAGATGAPQGFRKRPGELVIGTLAPLRPEKNLGRLIRVFSGIAAATPALLVIAGDGSQRSALEAQVRQLGLAERVIFLGNASEPEIVLKNFDVFTISSDTEQMPTTILEAMAAGLPIAGVDVGDVKAMVVPENRPFIVDRDDDAAFGRAILGLLAAAQTRADLGHKNQEEAAARYSQDAMFAAYDALFSA